MRETTISVNTFKCGKHLQMYLQTYTYIPDFFNIVNSAKNPEVWKIKTIVYFYNENEY